MESCDEDDDVGVGVVEELADKPGNYEWHMVWKIAINSLALFGEMWFLTAGPVVGIPMILAEIPERKKCGSFFKKHHRNEKVQFFDTYRCFFFCLHLAVGRRHRHRTPQCPHGLQLSRVKVSLADHMHTRSGIHHELSFLWLFSMSKWCSALSQPVWYRDKNSPFLG